MGAWIETQDLQEAMAELGVAPYMGAWIETSVTIFPQTSPLSLPIWERGLKRQRSGFSNCVFIVAPYMGAWIETGDINFHNVTIKSLPIWERGLKQLN